MDTVDFQQVLNVTLVSRSIAPQGRRPLSLGVDTERMGLWAPP